MDTIYCAVNLLQPAPGTGSAESLGEADPFVQVIPGKAALIVGVIEVVTLVAELRFLRQYQKAVGKAPGDQVLLSVFCCRQLIFRRDTFRRSGNPDAGPETGGSVYRIHRL